MKHRSRGHQRSGPRKYNNNRPPRENQRENQRDNQQNFHARSSGSSSSQNYGGGRPVIQSILPSPEIFQEYEYASEGTVARLLSMAETEQDRRNAWEDEYLRFYKKSQRLGQLFGFILLCAITYGTIHLGEIGQVDLAKFLVLTGFGSVAAASLFSEIGKRLSRRPRRGGENFKKYQ